MTTQQSNGKDTNSKVSIQLDNECIQSNEDWKRKIRYIINDFHLGTLVAIDTGNDSFEKTEKAKDWMVEKISTLLETREKQILASIKEYYGEENEIMYLKIVEHLIKNNEQ